tara:strand:+ start:9371 stop:10513 length:1143 start_codon:yes stop_codon:yes gene_type:complete
MNKSLHIVQTFGLHDMQGRTAHVANLTHSMVKLKHTPEIVAAAYNSNYPESLEINSVNVTYLKSNARYRSLTLNVSAKDYLIKRVAEVDIVHIHGLYDLLGPVSSKLCLGIGKPYVVETMGMVFPFGRGGYLKRGYMELFGKTLLNNAARYVVTSKMEAEHLEDAGYDPKKIAFRHNGVDPIRRPESNEIRSFRDKYKLEPGLPKIIFLGRIAPVKNLEKLIQEFYILANLDAILILAGPIDDNKYFHELKKLINSLGIQDRVVWTGPLFGVDKACLFHEGDIFVLPSMNENFGIAAAEAMTVGLPVIATQTCGITEHFEGDAGIVVDFTDGSLVKPMRELLSKNDFKLEIGIKGKKAVELLSWDMAAKLTANMYGEILN